MSFIFDALVEIYLTYMKPRIVLWTMVALLVAFILLVAAFAFGLIGPQRVAWFGSWGGLFRPRAGFWSPRAIHFSGRQGQIANLARFSFWAFGAPRGNAALGDGLF